MDHLHHVHGELRQGRFGGEIFSQEIPSDITVRAGGATFSLHKFPLVSKCGLIRKMVSEANDADLSLLDLPDVPGGAEAFELVAKFCYGINFEVTIESIAMLRCAAEHLEMTEDYAAGNLVSRAEDYLNEAALTSLPSAVEVLRHAQGLLPAAEKVNLVGRCVDAVALLASEEGEFEHVASSPAAAPPPSGVVDWWAEELTVLRVDIFKRVVMAIKRRGSEKYAVGPLLMLYAQKSLRGLVSHRLPYFLYYNRERPQMNLPSRPQDIFGMGKKKIEPKKEHEKRVILETIVSLLPRERNAMSVSFLATLLRAAIYLETTVACRLDLERRISSQLEQAVLDDLLIPSFSFAGDAAFDVDTVQRILVNYLEADAAGDDDDDGGAAAAASQIGGLMEAYLAEVAADGNLSVPRFISFAELIPEAARATEDGMYRAIDIFLKKVCGVMDCQKLSREACAHAAQNSRLPVQIVVQVLYYEQQRLREGGGTATGGNSPALPSSLRAAAPDELSRLRRENEGLKLEVVKLKMQLREAQKPAPAAPRRHRRRNRPPFPPPGSRHYRRSRSSTQSPRSWGS
ncbi:unnamed protein product [Spirodela intermedia]|uniref:Uncharacterized protein n=1 Tax=Spirodela intermedia TaxID=51605 RepID=A0A7I8IYC9_SPIIN|nr:unnamed protein product [Spirodela intermedia]CAA6662974.1 unnamed protein product [Spirodela intermedia]